MWSAHHRRLVALAWLILVVAAAGACLTVEANTDVDPDAPGETREAGGLINERFGERFDAPTEFLVFGHPSLRIDDPAYRQTVEGLAGELRTLRATTTARVGDTRVTEGSRVVSSTLTHYDIEVSPDVSPFVAEREDAGDATFAIVQLEGDFDDALANIDQVLDVVASYEAPDGFEILIGGMASQFTQNETIIMEDFNRAGVINLPVTFAILILAFGAIVAALVPLVLAFAAVFVALGLLALVSQGFPLADVYIQVVLLLGLATGIDYALFVLTRYRNERRAGRSKDDALRVATGTSGKAVVFAGTTTVFAVAGMFLVRDTIFSSLGLAAIVIVVIALVSAVTLLPAAIAFLGDNVDRLSLPFVRREERREQARGEGLWGAVIDRALARPLVSALVATAALIAIAAPILTLNLGFNAARGLSDDVEAKQAFLALEENFVLGLAQPAVVVVDAGEKGNVFSSALQSSVFGLLAMIQEESVLNDPDAYFGRIAQAPAYNDAGDTALVFVPLNADSGEQHAIDAVQRLRNDLIPAAFPAEDPARALVTGATAANIDFRDNIYFRTPMVFGFVLGLAFLILLLTFRSVTIAATAIFLNLLSVGFAYGLLVVVFQEGYLLENVLNFEATGIIESWLPLFLFSILFGLSIDYEMYVMTRVKEEYERGATTEEAIARGVKGTAGVITNAAAIMVAVALIFAFTRNIGLQQFGFGLAAAVFIDATVIRAFVLPTVMKLLGEWNWYFPAWLRWLPSINMAENLPGEGRAPALSRSRPIAPSD